MSSINNNNNNRKRKCDKISNKNVEVVARKSTREKKPFIPYSDWYVGYVKNKLKVVYPNHNIVSIFRKNHKLYSKISCKCFSAEIEDSTQLLISWYWRCGRNQD